MHLAYYAPLKSPDHERPSGDRTVARLIRKALQTAGHDVTLISDFRSRASSPDDIPLITAKATTAGHEMLNFIASARPQIDAWVTYHSYYKAPDFLGPLAASTFRLPYMVIEPSHAPKREHGPWAEFHRINSEGLQKADALVCPTQHDMTCIRDIANPEATVGQVPPFLDVAPFEGLHPINARHELRHRFGLEDGVPVLMTVAMMRKRDKLPSYQCLAQALERLRDRPWSLIIIGDGEAKAEVEAAFANLSREGRIHFAGQLQPPEIPRLLSGADLFVWPAINEAYGMVFLEAQAAGLPVVAGGAPGVKDVVKEGQTGFIAPEGDPISFANAISVMLTADHQRRQMGMNAKRFVFDERTIARAAMHLDEYLMRATSLRVRRNFAQL